MIEGSYHSTLVTPFIKDWCSVLLNTKDSMFAWTYQSYRFSEITVFFSHNKSVSASVVFSASRTRPRQKQYKPKTSLRPMIKKDSFYLSSTCHVLRIRNLYLLQLLAPHLVHCNKDEVVRSHWTSHLLSIPLWDCGDWLVHLQADVLWFFSHVIALHLIFSPWPTAASVWSTTSWGPSILSERIIRHGVFVPQATTIRNHDSFPT